MKTVIEMAREAGFNKNELAYLGDNFTRFAELVRADSQRTWAELTDEEFDEATAYANPHCDEWAFAKAIEAILREKNS